VHCVDPAARTRLEAALCSATSGWSAGPFSEPVGALLRSNASALSDLFETFDGLAARVESRGRETVITHGEPHSGNMMRVEDAAFVVDWDTVGLAVPERDLWMVAESEADLALYTDATGRDVDRDALALYRLRWMLDDVCMFVDLLRSPHVRTEDTERAWSNLKLLLEADRPRVPM
jgi:spectinomycin phosphotransferase